ncbi:MAG TPA: c-type cytochrome [Xanthobacteraceae bacterium]|jgi:cytochrome c553|nr:c-type cytochrome [Xanthobacteraceae bacterium]
MKTLTCAFVLALLPTLAGAIERPDWAFPPAGVTGAPRPPETGELKRVPGSTKTYTQSQIDAFNEAPDWFPDAHPQMPDIVARGKGTQVRACISCHLSTGHGHPENSRLPGSTAGYIARQLADFRSGARKGAANMITFTKAMSDADMRTVAEYFASLPVKRWTRVVEADTVPKSYFVGTRRMPLPAGGTEPIGARVIELPEDAHLVELRDPNSGFVSYVPPGSLAKGQMLVATGGDGRTIACTICHGPTLKGLGDVPGLANQSPVNIARQLYLFGTEARSGPWAVLMKQVVEKLTNDDIVAITAFIASLDP